MRVGKVEGKRLEAIWGVLCERMVRGGGGGGRGGWGWGGLAMSLRWVQSIISKKKQASDYAAS